MGKAVPKIIKSRAEYLLKKFPEKFSKDFAKNKLSLTELHLPLSPVSRNILAAFIGRQKAKEQV